MENNNYSYQFEYYAKPVDLSTIGETKVTNTFKLTDEVKKYGSDEKFTFDNVNSSVEVILQGNYHLNAAKKPGIMKNRKKMQQRGRMVSFIGLLK